jgi:hypothetical protein
MIGSACSFHWVPTSEPGCRGGWVRNGKSACRLESECSSQNGLPLVVKRPDGRGDDSHSDLTRLLTATTHGQLVGLVSLRSPKRGSRHLSTLSRQSDLGHPQRGRFSPKYSKLMLPVNPPGEQLGRENAVPVRSRRALSRARFRGLSLHQERRQRNGGMGDRTPSISA